MKKEIFLDPPRAAEYLSKTGTKVHRSGINDRLQRDDKLPVEKRKFPHARWCECGRTRLIPLADLEKYKQEKQKHGKQQRAKVCKRPRKVLTWY